LPQARGRCSKGCFPFRLLLTSCSFRDSKVPQIYTPGELVEHTATMRLRQIWRSRLSSSLFVDASSTTTQPRTGTSAAPPLRANSMTSVTSSLPVLARTLLCPLQYLYSRQASDGSPASTKTLVTLLTLSSKTIQIMWDTQSDVRSHLRYAPRLYLNTGKYLTRATPGHEHSSWALRRPWRSTRSARSSSAPAQMTVT